MGNTDEFFTGVCRDYLGEGTPGAGVLAGFNTWARYEGTAARFNPLACEWLTSGSSAFNSSGVQNYPSESGGQSATAQNLQRDGGRTYPAILALIKANGDASAWHNPEVIAQIRIWGTEGFANLLAENGALNDDYDAPSLPTTPAPEPTPSPTPPQSATQYVVQTGDTLSGIAQRYGLSWETLLAFDGNATMFPNPDLIYPGQVVEIPGTEPTPAPSPEPPPAPEPPAPTTSEYIVVKGDNEWAIAQAHHMTLAQLEALNPESGHPPGDFSMIWPGDVLRVS